MATDKPDKLAEILEKLRKELEKIAPPARMPRGVLMTLHRDAIHAIRKFAAEGYFRVILEYEKLYGPYEDLANCCRNAMASALKCQQRDIDCTIKISKGEKGQPNEEGKVWTFARSTVSPARPEDLGPDCFRKIGENSMFAALVGCKDRKTNWYPYRYCSFGCNNLPAFDNYDDTDDDWETWYRSALVFPLRFEAYSKGEDKHHDYIIGFLTFDSLDTNIFEGIPSIFHYIGEPVDYEHELMKCDAFHVGAVIADAIATALMLEKRRLRRLRKLKESDNGFAAQRKGT